MKKQIISILLLLVLTALPATISFAQSPISKGAYTVNGNISYTSQTFESTSYSEDRLSFNPQFGYFIIDNVYAALILNYSHWSIGNSKSDIYGIGPAVRYYFNADKIKPFLGVGYIYNELTQTGVGGNINSNEWKISGGADYFITNNFALEASVNYSFINFNYSSVSYTPVSSKSNLLALGIGVNYFIY